MTATQLITDARRANKQFPLGWSVRFLIFTRSTDGAARAFSIQGEAQYLVLVYHSSQTTVNTSFSAPWRRVPSWPIIHRRSGRPDRGHVDLDWTGRGFIRHAGYRCIGLCTPAADTLKTQRSQAEDHPEPRCARRTVRLRRRRPEGRARPRFPAHGYPVSGDRPT